MAIKHENAAEDKEKTKNVFIELKIYLQSSHSHTAHTHKPTPTHIHRHRNRHTHPHTPTHTRSLLRISPPRSLLMVPLRDTVHLQNFTIRHFGRRDESTCHFMVHHHSTRVHKRKHNTTNTSVFMRTIDELPCTIHSER